MLALECAIPSSRQCPQGLYYLGSDVDHDRVKTGSLFEMSRKTHGPMTDFPKYGRFRFRNIPSRVQVIAIRRNTPRTRFAG